MTFRENNQRLTNPGGPLQFLEITNPSFSEPMRVANDTQDWISQGITYVGIPFGFTLPEDVSGVQPRLALTMSNVGTDITQELEQIAPGSKTMAKLILVDRGSPDVHEHVIWLPLTNVTLSTSTATANAGVDEWMRQVACKQYFTPHTTPGLF